MFFPTQEPFSREERRLALLAALLLPLRAAQAPPARKKGAALPASSHIVREAIKWRTRDAEAVAEVHGAALELLRLHARLRVPRPALNLLWCCVIDLLLSHACSVSGINMCPIMQCLHDLNSICLTLPPVRLI